jgi:hypothetical protein
MWPLEAEPGTCLGRLYKRTQRSFRRLAVSRWPMSHMGQSRSSVDVRVTRLLIPQQRRKSGHSDTSHSGHVRTSGDSVSAPPLLLAADPLQS